MVTRAISKIDFVDVNDLNEHEEINLNRVREVYDIIQTNMSVHPILVDNDSKVILDGHHRYNALRKIGVSRIPVFFIDYGSKYVMLDSWRIDLKVTKDEVIKMGKSNDLFPPKTSRHTIKGIPDIQIAIDVFKVN